VDLIIGDTVIPAETTVVMVKSYQQIISKVIIANSLNIPTLFSPDSLNMLAIVGEWIELAQPIIAKID
jgi:hypothetical protein